MPHHQSLLAVLRYRHMPKPVSNFVLSEIRGRLDRGHHIPHRTVGNAKGAVGTMRLVPTE
eukprot:3140672-Prymnesium_polylepis.1